MGYFNTEGVLMGYFKTGDFDRGYINIQRILTKGYFKTHMILMGCIWDVSAPRVLYQILFREDTFSIKDSRNVTEAGGWR